MKIAEVDYMSDKDFEAIYAITFEAPNRIGTMIALTLAHFCRNTVD